MGKENREKGGKKIMVQKGKDEGKEERGYKRNESPLKFNRHFPVVCNIIQCGVLAV
jgi:hypothetical protein